MVYNRKSSTLANSDGKLHASLYSFLCGGKNCIQVKILQPSEERVRKWRICKGWMGLEAGMQAAAPIFATSWQIRFVPFRPILTPIFSPLSGWAPKSIQICAFSTFVHCIRKPMHIFPTVHNLTCWGTVNGWIHNLSVHLKEQCCKIFHCLFFSG